MAEQPKGGINHYIDLEKHNFDQIATRNTRMSLDKHITFSKSSYDVSEAKLSKNPAVLTNRWNHSHRGPGVTI